jgi:hypothetical protein
VNGLKVKDAIVAIPEDMIAIGFEYFLVRGISSFAMSEAGDFAQV